MKILPYSWTRSSTNQKLDRQTQKRLANENPKASTLNLAGLFAASRPNKKAVSHLYFSEMGCAKICKELKERADEIKLTLRPQVEEEQMTGLIKAAKKVTRAANLHKTWKALRNFEELCRATEDLARKQDLEIGELRLNRSSYEGFRLLFS